MSELYMGTFQTPALIMCSLEQYLFLSPHDHEEGPIRGRFPQATGIEQEQVERTINQVAAPRARGRKAATLMEGSWR
jgi:hypothetical protein